jgi:RHS repeat-associated protein
MNIPKLALSLLVLVAGIAFFCQEAAGQCSGSDGSVNTEIPFVETFIYIEVYLNDVLQQVQLASGLDITGQTAFGTCNDEVEVASGTKARVGACKYDDLLITVAPEVYQSGATVDRWVLDGVTDNTSDICYKIPDVTDNPIVDVEIYLVSDPTDDPIRDPVSSRWNPDAGRRSGGDLTWGPAYLTAKSQVSDVTSESYPALMYSGEAYEKQVDFAVAGRGLDFIFSRVHRSGVPDSGSVHFGGQWAHSFDIQLKSPEVGVGTSNPVEIRLGNGSPVVFRQKYLASPSRYYYAEGWDAELALTQSGSTFTYRLRFGDGVLWTFVSFGIEDLSGIALPITSISDRFGNTLDFAYDGSDRLETITDTLGREYTLAYSDGVIESLTEEDGLGRVVSYAYDGGRLDTVTYPATTASATGTVIEYDYDSDGRLERVTDPRGNVILTNNYNGDGKLGSQQFGEGTEAGTVTYGYTGLSLSGGEDDAIRVTDASGHVTEHFFNARNQLVRLHRHNDAAGFITLIAWAEHAFSGSIVVSDDQPETVTLPDGIVVEYEYTGPGSADADYKFRMNPTSITRTGTDGKTLAEVFGHNTLGGSVDFWDARFGDSFVTCHSLHDGSETLLSATAYTYSSDDTGTLDGIDYFGIAPYAGDPFAPCGFASQSMLMQQQTSTLPGFALQSMLAAEEMYSVTMQTVSAASAMYSSSLALMSYTPYETQGYSSSSLEEGGISLMAMASADHHESFGYNAFGQITEHLYPDNDEDGDPSDKVRRLDTFDYDANGNLDEQIIDADGEALISTFINDAVGRVTKITDPKSNATDFAYDELDQVITVEAPALASASGERPKTTISYDENGNVERIRRYWFETDGTPIPVAGETNANDDLATEFTYDSRNRVVEVGRENGTSLTVSEFQYDGNGNVTKHLSPLAVDTTEPGNVIEYEYDERDLPVRVLRSNELVTRIDYDAGGRVIRTIEGYGTAEARLSSADYDGLGYLKETIDATGLTTEYATDALGRATAVQAMGENMTLARTEYVYDILGRLTNINALHKTDFGVGVGDGWMRTVLAYTDAGMLLSETIEGDATTCLYDTVMRRERVTSPAGNKLLYAYDDNGNVSTLTEHAFDTDTATATNFITRYGYDELDRVIAVGNDDGDGVDTDAKTTRYAYDSLDQLIEEEDARGNITRNTYDALGRLDSTTHDPAGIAALIDYGYDANDRLVTMTDPNSNETEYFYDKFDRLTRTEYANGQIETLRYDAVDNVTEHSAPGGLSTNAIYDGRGRPTSQTFSQLGGRENPGQTTYQYDLLGRVTEVRNDGTAVTRTYDTLSLPASETTQVGEMAANTLRRTYNSKGQLASIDPPGDSSNNRFDYARNADGLVTGVTRDGSPLAGFDYLGPRPNRRTLTSGVSLMGTTAIDYEETGLRPNSVNHEDGASATVDTRAYTWDDAYNLEDYQITGGTLSAASVNWSYDALNRLDPASISAAWTLDDAGNRAGGGYAFTGNDQRMHRYTEVNSLPHYHDPQGALMAMETDANSLHFYHYDANDRLDYFREITFNSATAFNALDVNDGDWTVLNGTWAVNDNGTAGDPSDDYLEETSSDIGAILYAPETLPGDGITFRYRSPHDPDNPDGDGTPGEFDGDDHPAKYYAQALLFVDSSFAPSYIYGALRIEPDRLSVIIQDGATLQEIDSVEVETAANTWYTVKYWHVSGGSDDGTISIVRFSETPGDSVSMLLNVPRVDAPSPLPIGFTVGALADYEFQLVEYADGPDTTEIFIDWAYDAFGRKAAETVYDNTNAIVAQTLFVWDGWRLVSEVDGVTGKPVAEYIPGPTYIDDTVAVRRDLNRDGDFGDPGEGFLFYLSDQQHSTVALLDENGNVVERYGYDAFGEPTFYDGNGTPLTQTAYGNNRLYTGREYLPDLGVYDYRQRLYDPATGRFLSTDPVYDPANLGNPYTYVANNPGAFVDPYGENRRLLYDVFVAGFTEGLPYALGKGVEALGDFAAEVVSGYNPFRHVSIGAPSHTVDFSDADAAVHFASQAQHPLYSQATTKLIQTRDEIRAGVLGATVEVGQDSLIGGAAGVGIKAGLKEIRKQGAKNASKLLKPLPATVEKSNKLVLANVNRYSSYSAFKRAHGSAGKGMEWHHIVEQTPGNVSQFGEEALHNTWNIVAIDVTTHRKISGYYSSILDFTGSQTLRQWISSKPFDEQRKFGIKVLQDFGVLP